MNRTDIVVGFLLFANFSIGYLLGFANCNNNNNPNDTNFKSTEPSVIVESMVTEGQLRLENRLYDICDNFTGCASTDSATITNIVKSVIKHSEANGISPDLVISTIAVENPWLDSVKVSSAGAVGLKQVMPFWAGVFEECGNNLKSVDDNICHGSNIMANYIRQSMLDALLEYNGCKPHWKSCNTYSSKVLDQ